MYRQGDVLAIPVEELPEEAVEVDHCVLARGEATGHAHRVESGATQYVSQAGEQFLRVLAGGAELRHEEHGTIRLPGPAVYRIVIQHEYDPEAPGTRRRELRD